MSAISPPLPPKSSPPNTAWQTQLEDRGTTFDNLLTSGKLSDVTIVAGYSRRRFRVHKLMLSSRSPLFEQMFYSDRPYVSDVLPLQDDCPLAFQWILQHIYSDRLDLDNIDLALEVLSVSDKYLISSAYKAAFKYIEHSLKRNNVLKLYAKLYNQSENDQPLLKVCRKIFEENGNSVLTSNCLQDISLEVLESLLKENLKVTSEVVVFNAVISWSLKNLDKRRESASNKAIRQEMATLLPYIKFLAMSSEEFLQHVLMTDALSADDAVLVLKCLVKLEIRFAEDSEQSFDELKAILAKRRFATTIEKRPSLLTKESMKNCNCEMIQGSWHGDREYECIFTASDNVVLLAFKLQTDTELPLVKIEISKDNSADRNTIASIEGKGREQPFRNPVHLMEGVAYRIKISVPPNCRLFGSTKPAAEFRSQGFIFEFRKGIYISGFIFI